MVNKNKKGGKVKVLLKQNRYSVGDKRTIFLHYGAYKVVREIEGVGYLVKCGVDNRLRTIIPYADAYEV